MKGFLPTAIADAQVALEQVERADLEGRINDFWLYGGYVLNALDPGPETQALVEDGVRASADQLREDRGAWNWIRHQARRCGGAAARAARGKIRGRVGQREDARRARHRVARERREMDRRSDRHGAQACSRQAMSAAARFSSTS